MSKLRPSALALENAESFLIQKSHISVSEYPLSLASANFLEVKANLPKVIKSLNMDFIFSALISDGESGPISLIALTC